MYLEGGMYELRGHLEAVVIHDQDLPMYLWVEAARTTVYVQNKISHSAIGFKTSKEMFTGKKPEVCHLKIFGCPVFVHIPKEKRTKLDSSKKKGIFLGIVSSPRPSKSIYRVPIIWKLERM